MDKKFLPNKGSSGELEVPLKHPDGLDLTKRLGLRPTHMLVITLAGIFLAEVIAMMIISFLGTMSYVWLVLVDALIMVAIVFPVQYFLSFRPLLAYLNQREQALAELNALQLELEQRVEQRTTDLNQANQSLENEIVERKQAEEQLRYQATLLENVSDAIIASDLDFNITSWNQAAETLYGWRADEVIGKPSSEILQTEYAHKEPQEVRHQFLERGEWKGEAVQVRRDGAKIDILASVSFVRDRAGQPVGAVSVNRDITERKHAEAEIRSLAKFPGENPNPVLRVGIDGSVLYANPASADLLHWWNCSIGEMLPGIWRQVVTNTFDAGRLIEQELLCGERVFSLVFAPILDGGYVNIYGRDITDRKHAEEALQQSEERFAKAFRSSPAAISITRLSDGRFVDVNDSFLKIFGFTRQELFGRSSIDLYADPNERVKLIQRLLEQKSVRDVELKTRAKSGQEIQILLSTETIMLKEENHVLATLYDITERKLMEAVLRENEAQLRLAHDAADIGVWRLDFLTGRILMDERARTHYGFDTGECSLAGLLERVYPEDSVWLDQEIAAILEPASPARHNAEYRMIHPGGDVHWLSVHTLVYFEGQGDARRPAQVIGTSQDITQRKQTEQAILLAKQEWERTFDAVPDLIMILDEQQNIIRLNRAMAERTGLSIQKCIGRKSYQLVHDTAGPVDYCPHCLTWQDGQPRTGELHEPYLGGDFLVSTTPLYDPQGNMTGSVFVARDISDRKQAELALRQAHDELELRVQQRTAELAIANEVLAHTNQELITQATERERAMAQLRLASAALEAAANGIFITGRDGDIQWINPALSKMTGYLPEEIIGQNPRLIKSGKQSQEYYQQMWDTILSGQVWRGEITNRRKDGSTYIEEQTITPILDAEGKITNFVAIKQDITERIQAEQTLIQTNELLGRYFSSIDILIAYMDRDFNFIRVNDAYAKSAGYPVEFFHGKNHFGLYPNAENQDIFQRVADTGEPFTVFEKPFEYPDHPEWGVTYWDWSLQPVKSLDGSVEGLVLSLVDVTGRKRAELELARQNQELLALSQVEHELREFAESLAQSTIILNFSLELEQVLVTILEQIRRAIPFTAGDIILKEGRSYRIAGILNTREVNQGWPPPDMSLSLDDFPLLDQIFTTLQPLLLTEVDGSEEWQRAAGLEWVRSYVGAPLVAAGQVFGIINLHSDQPGAFDQRTVERLIAYTAPAAAAIQNAWLFEQVRSSRESLQALSRRLVEVQEGERRYIASELHDEVGQALTGLTLGLQLVEKNAENPQAIRTEVAEMNRLLESVLDELHRLAMDLRPASLDHLGLAAALRQHVAMVNEKYGLVAQFEMVGIHDRLPPEMEIALYRIVQEALNNVVRHAQAKSVDVILKQRDNCLVLIVEDDGVGFDLQDTLKKSGRLGLFGMRERAEMLGGNLIIESAAGKGTTIVVEAPHGEAYSDS